MYIISYFANIFLDLIILPHLRMMLEVIEGNAVERAAFHELTNDPFVVLVVSCIVLTVSI